MSAEILRRAASLMRERAEGADKDTFSRSPWSATIFDDGRAWLKPAHIAMHGYPNTAEHIASWHPAVALAVADWLWEMANHEDIHGDINCKQGCLHPTCRVSASALTVARAYLGESS